MPISSTTPLRPAVSVSCTAHLYSALLCGHNYDLTIDNLEVDGETARVTVRSLFRELWENDFGMPSGMYTFRIDLRRVDGVWLMTDISPNSIYGDERHGTYDDLLDNIAELEAECVNAAK